MNQFHSRSDYIRSFLLLFDVAVFSFVFWCAVNLYDMYRPDQDIDRSAHFGLLAFLLFVFVLFRNLRKNSTVLGRPTMSSEAWSLTKEIGFTLAIGLGFIFVMRFDYVSRVVLFGFAIGSLVALIATHWFWIWWCFARRNANPEHSLHILVIGSGARARGLAHRICQNLEFGVEIVGFLDPRGECAGRREDDSILGHTDQIGEVLRNYVVEEVIVAVPRSLIGDIQSIVDACQEEGVRLRFMADVYDFRAARIRLTMVDEIPLLSFEPVARAEKSLIAKRIFDLVAVICGLPLLIPLLLIVSIAIKLDTKGPILFTQDRVGLHKRRFRMWKFRSMVTNAEALMGDIEHLNEADGPNFKIKDDPRVTRVGRFIRKTSIDELPQLYNVLRGEMSLVGPRPMSRRDVDLFDRGIQRKRFSVMPGMTCLWQISGRNDLGFDEWLKLDLDYIEHWTFWYDLKILILTIPAVFKGSGAA